MKTHGYGRPHELAPNLWELRGEWSNKLGRRMTVVRLEDGGVVVHNAMKLLPDDLAWLTNLGPVRSIVAPNKFHCSDAPWMAAQFPSAAVFVPKSKLAEFEASGLKPRDVAMAFPPELASELECIPMPGTRIDESAFIHHRSRTLILCDLAMNMEDVFTGLQGTFMRWNKVGGMFGVTRLTKLLFTRDRAELVKSYDRLLGHDFDRVIVNHGAVLETDGHSLLKQSVSALFPRAAAS